MKYIVPRRVHGVSLMDEFDRMVGDIFNDFTGSFGGTRMPAVDVREEDDRYVLEAELPGMTEKDIEVKVEDTLLTIASRHEEKRDEEQRNGYIIRERSRTEFKRSFVLPKDVDRDNIHATFRNGLLELTLAKKPEAQPKSIEIKIEK
jgi:HSP20 family protein